MEAFGALWIVKELPEIDYIMLLIEVVVIVVLLLLVPLENKISLYLIIKGKNRKRMMFWLLFWNVMVTG